MTPWVRLTATVSFTGNATLMAGASGVALGGDRGIAISDGVIATFDVQEYDMSISGVVSGLGGLAKVGSGPLVLDCIGTNVNTYEGGTTVSEGTLKLDASDALPGGSILTMEATGTLDLNGQNVSLSSLDGAVGAVITDTGSSSGTSTLTVDIASGLSPRPMPAGFIAATAAVPLRSSRMGLGTLVFSGEIPYGKVDVSAGTTVNAGTLQGTTRSLKGAIDINGYATVVFDQVFGSSFYGEMSGGGALTKQGTGEVIFNGNCDMSGFYGTANLNGGVVTISDDSNFGCPAAWTFNGGTLTVTDAMNFSSSVTLNAGGGTFDLSDTTANTSISGPISGTGSLTKKGAGTLVLDSYDVNSVDNSYSGGTTISEGQVVLGPGESLGSGGLAMNGGTLNLNGNSISVSSLSGVASALITDYNGNQRRLHPHGRYPHGRLNLCRRP